MTLREWVVSAVILVELIVGGAWVGWQRSQPAPPVPGLSGGDPLAADQVREQAARCRSADDWGRLGETYLALGSYAHAEACFRQAAVWQPRRPDRAFDLAFALERLGRTAEANEQYRKAIESGHPLPADCWYFVGRNHLREEKPDLAREAFKKAGRHPSSEYELAKLLVRGGALGEAADVLDRLAAEHPTAVQPPLLRCRIEVPRGDRRAEARFADTFLRATDRLPTPFDEQSRRLIDAHARMGQPGEWQACRELLDAGKFEEADWRLTVGMLARDPAAIDLLGESKLRQRRPELAVAMLTIATVLEPSAYTFTRLGDAHEESGQLNEALKAWGRAIDLGSAAELKDLLYRMAVHYERLTVAGLARHHMTRAYFGAGVQAFAKGMWSDARVALEKAVELEPEFAHAWFTLGEGRRVLKQGEQARQAYERCLKINPDHGRALESLALLEP